ncbi:MAG: glycosyltransferase [Salinisphaera sp.]|uniref:glycosyltransferase n=1 Tax=Salinisphaera sp. TaxID=1914330 RepID=UPI003C7ECA89
MDSPLAIAHYVSLSELGGVERQFRRFVIAAAGRADIRQSAVICSKRVHPQNRSVLTELADHRLEKNVLGQALPRQPRILRAWRNRWIARRQDPDVALLWNRLGQQNRVLDALGPRRCLYWEHGSAWLYGEDEAKRAALSRLPAVVCNSFAARRMLEQRWDYDGVVRVCPNGVNTERAATIRGDVSSPLRLGMACRLVPIKAVCVALHMLAELISRGVDARLDIAGDGPLRSQLEAQARELDLTDRLCFRGAVGDMDGFFADIDIFVHTALREPFGMVAAEAQAAGVPVVCTAIDGLPEVVADGETGRCVVPTGDLARHQQLGGHNDGLPPYVYAPDEDRVVAPRVCEPAALADAIAALVVDRRRYAAMSAAGVARMAARFGFDRHVDRVIAAAREYHASGTLEASA